MHVHAIRLTRSLAVLATLALAFSMLIASAPEASAHSGKFEHDDSIRGAVCPDGTVPNGQQSDSRIGCTHVGYAPIGSDMALCDEASGIMIGGYCTFDSARPCGTSVAFAQPVGGGDCVRPALVLSEYVVDRGGKATTPVCIETDLVQSQHPALQASNIFRTDDTVYLIITGGPTCTFNCHNKWDINCDGKLGDFCSVEYDLDRVGDVGKCLADLGIAPTPYVG